ncbi:MAG: hypothetical protein HYU87_08880, partial [Chloroflexi bacterium]|nr:hypothetical protein [Chloroflexota bacterium]
VGIHQATYWRGHLAIAPNLYDPTYTIVSLGDFGGTEAQYAIRGNGPDPGAVSVGTGLVRYDLVSWEYEVRGHGGRCGPCAHQSTPRRACGEPVRTAPARVRMNVGLWAAQVLAAIFFGLHGALFWRPVDARAPLLAASISYGRFVLEPL